MNKRTFNFTDSFKKAVPYNEIFQKWLESRDNIKSVRIANIQEEKLGIDYLALDCNDKEWKIQLKVEFLTDETGNIPIETISQAYSYKNSVIGAEFKYAEVDFIFYLLVNSKRILGFRVNELMEYAIKNYEKFYNFGANNEYQGITYRTLGILVPLNKIMSLVKWASSFEDL
jgi:hypothetical protein